ncbi:hypothetical protein ACQZV8_00435 [Magnetococcales bacterium HHB-1]
MRFILFLLSFHLFMAGDLIAGDKKKDLPYHPVVSQPTYPAKQGPTVYVDEAHNNWHTIKGRFNVFANLLEQDGYVVKPSKKPFSKEMLADKKILVVSNALHDKNMKEYNEKKIFQLPTPSAFSDQEIEALVDWVHGGGSLMLIVDHMPWGGANEKLAARFGFILQNAFAFRANFPFDNPASDQNLIMFYNDKKAKTTDSKLIDDHPIARGKHKKASIPFVTSFTGQGFRVRTNQKIAPLMVLGEGTTKLYPSEYNTMTLQTPSAMAVDLLQGATRQFGKGRVAMFGEAGMFSARIAEWDASFLMGMNNPKAPHNQQFTLNVIHWLSK